MIRKLAFAAAASLFLAAPASAAIVITADANIKVVTGEYGVEVELKLQDATNVTAFNANYGSQNGLPVFLFNTVGSVDVSNGNATVKPNDDPFTSLKIFAPAQYKFEDFNFSILDAPSFTVTSSNGGSVHVSDPNGLSNGLSEWTAYTLSATADLTWVMIQADLGGDFKQMKHFAISGLTFNDVVVDPNIGAATPEPATWFMMIAGFAGVSAMAYRRRRKAFA